MQLVSGSTVILIEAIKQPKPQSAQMNPHKGHKTILCPLWAVPFAFSPWFRLFLKKSDVFSNCTIKPSLKKYGLH